MIAKATKKQDKHAKESREVRKQMLKEQGGQILSQFYNVNLIYCTFYWDKRMWPNLSQA